MPSARRKFRSSRVPRGQDRLGVELHALRRARSRGACAMISPSAVARGEHEARRAAARRRPASGSASASNWLAEAGEQPGSSCHDLHRPVLPCIEPRRAHDACRRTPRPMHWCPRQTPRIGTRPARRSISVDRDAGLVRRAGPGRDDEVRRAACAATSSAVELVVRGTRRRAAPSSAEALGEVVGERVVVVDQEHARGHRPYAPVSRQVDGALQRGHLVDALLVLELGHRVGHHAAAGLQRTTPSRITIVRSAMHVSIAPPKPM